MTAYQGVFNVTAPPGGYTPLIPNDLSAATANTEALQQMVYALLDPTNSTFTNGQGGTLQFPSSQGPYYFGSGSISIGPNPNTETTYPASIIFMGTGQDSQTDPLLIQTTDDDLFIVQNNPGTNDSIGGITFQDLFIKYNVPSSQTPPSSAIRVTDSPYDEDPGMDGGGLNVRVFRMVFQDCPVAVTFGHSGHCNVTQTSIISTAGNSHTQCGIIVGDPVSKQNAIETYIADCHLETDHNNTGQTGITVYNAEHLRLVNTRIEAFQYGVIIKPAGLAVRTHFENVSIRQLSPTDATTEGGALIIQPQSGANVQESTFVNCEFGPTDKYGTNYTLGGVYIDGTLGAIDVLRFISCTSMNWPGPGLQMLSAKTSGSANCAHVEINGGEYSSNGQTSGTQQAGIVIGASGEAQSSIAHVRLIGVSCVGSVLGLSAQQQYGIYIADGANNVIVDHCDLTGNVYAAFVGAGTGGAPTNVFIRSCNVTGYANASTGGAFDFSSPGTLEVTDCAGYNDQNVVVNTNIPTATNNWAANQGGTGKGGINYFGPSIVTFVGANTVHINSDSWVMAYGSVYLPNATDPIRFTSGSPSQFQWIGK